MTLTAIDPGKKRLGWAHFDGNRLVSCGVSTYPNPATWQTNLADYADYHATQVPKADIAFVELMFQYPPAPDAKLSRKAQIAAANDLIEIQAIASIVAGRVAGKTQLRTAADWKGQIDKSITEHRVLDTLDELEISTMLLGLAKVAPSYRHNGIDACGMGLTFLGRMRK